MKKKKSRRKRRRGRCLVLNVLLCHESSFLAHLLFKHLQALLEVLYPDAVNDELLGDVKEKTEECS